MADFAPPPGPPPPKVPEGWKAVWNPQYSEWFFVNIYTKQSQWDKPTEPVYPPGEGPPHGAPPGYVGSASTGVSSHPTGRSEKSGFGSNNPYANMNEDEKLARKLQDEEEARAGRLSGDARGQANDYYNQPAQGGAYGQQSPVPYAQGGQSSYQDTSPQQDKGGKSKGLLGKLLGKATGGSSSSSSHGYPQQQYGYGQPQGYGGAPVGYYGGGYQQRPMGMPMGGGMMGGGRRPGGGGMGAGGAMALGAGGGLLGGALLGSAMADGGDGGDYGGDGGDYGGGDGGGDFGGDGGGDFGGDGGGDFGGGD